MGHSLEVLEGKGGSCWESPDSRSFKRPPDGGGHVCWPVLTRQLLSFGCVRRKCPVRKQAVRRSDRKLSNADRDRTQSRSNVCLSSRLQEAESHSDNKWTRRCDRPAHRPGLQAGQMAQTSSWTAVCTHAQLVSHSSGLLDLLPQEGAVGRASQRR